MSEPGNQGAADLHFSPMADPRPTAVMTDERAGQLLAGLPAPIDLGLSDAEIAAVEEQFGFSFAADHRILLQAGLPLGDDWPDWRNGSHEDLRSRHVRECSSM